MHDLLKRALDRKAARCRDHLPIDRKHPHIAVTYVCVVAVSLMFSTIGSALLAGALLFEVVRGRQPIVGLAGVVILSISAGWLGKGALLANHDADRLHHRIIMEHSNADA